MNILFPSNASDPLTMTAAGRADIGFYYQEDTIIARANEDVPVKVLGAVVQQPISIVCALAEKNIKTPEDLIGKTIGYSGTRFGEVAVGQMLETVGATLDDVELIDVGFDLMSAMTTGNVDATFGCFINHEVPALEEEGFAVDYMEVMDYGVPNYYALMLVTGEDQLEANRDKITDCVVENDRRNSGVPLVYHCKDKAEAKPVLDQLVRPGSTILVKASRGMELEELTAYLLSITPEAE